MVADDTVLTERAPAKINLTLHLCGQRADGYHLLDSVVVFTALGDTVQAEKAKGLSLSMSGPFASSLGTGDDNLVLRAAAGLAGAAPNAPGAALHLEKRLPVASGIGGGSSDAAAALRALSRLWSRPVPDGLALTLGADVPVCLSAKPCRMTGIGESLHPVAALPEAWLVLVNPMVSVSTGSVFGAIEDKNPPAGSTIPDRFPTFDDLARWLTDQRNDMQAAATLLCPPIAKVLEALSPAPVARMSGSGATCFALHPDESTAEAHAAEIRLAHPGWWVAASPILR